MEFDKSDFAGSLANLDRPLDLSAFVGKLMVNMRWQNVVRFSAPKKVALRLATLKVTRRSICSAESAVTTVRQLAIFAIAAERLSVTYR
jgi:hypothetical protein